MGNPNTKNTILARFWGVLKSLGRTIVLIWQVASDTMRRSYSPKTIKDGIEKISFGAALLLALGLIGLVIGSLLHGSSPFSNLTSITGWMKFIATSIVGALANLIDPAAETEVTHLLIDDPVKATTYLVVFGFAFSFLISLIFGVLRWTFERRYASLKFRNFLYDLYRSYFESNLLLRYKNRFILMAAIPLNIPKNQLMPDGTHSDMHSLLVIPDGTLSEGATIHPALPESFLPRLWQRLSTWDLWHAWAVWHWLTKRATVKAPSRIGYAAVSLDWTRPNTKSSITVVPCTYRNDLDSAYTLGYAHVAWYRRSRYLPLFGKSWVPSPVKRLRKLLDQATECQNKPLTHETLPRFLEEQVFRLRDGERHLGIRSQLGVQAVVIFNDYADGGSTEHPSWKIILQRRSKTVASSPEHFQFIPSGGFESHQTFHGKPFDSVLANTLTRECSLERGLLREFAEEVLGISEFASNEILDPDDVYREPAINRLRTLINAGKTRSQEKPEAWAELHMLGVALSMIGFKPEISFALIIDCKEFFISQRLRRAETEAQGIITWPLDHLAELVAGRQAFVDSSYALIKLLVGNAEVLNSLYDVNCPERSSTRDRLVNTIETCFSHTKPD